MGFREKTQDDIDLETLIDLFDTALTSNNPAMKKAIKNLLLIATLIDSELEPEQRIRGPLGQALDDMRDLTRRMDRLESDRWQVTNPGPGGPYTPNPNWIGPGNVPIPSPIWTSPNTVPSPGHGNPPSTGTPNWPPGSITCSASSTAFDDQFASDPNAKALGLYDKLEAK